MSQMLQMVQDQAEQGDFDELNDILGELGTRPQELFWKEDGEGRLYVSAQRSTPETVACIALDDGQLTADEVDAAEIGWRRLSTLSEPESAIQDRQYD